MFIAMNRFSVNPDRGSEFEERWRSRESYLRGLDGFVQFASKMLEEKLVVHNAMRPAAKPPGAKSALEGNVSVANQYQVANDMLNEMQRERKRPGHFEK